MDNGFHIYYRYQDGNQFDRIPKATGNKALGRCVTNASQTQGSHGKVVPLFSSITQIPELTLHLKGFLF
jgi:hypothetical protein